MRQLLVLLLLVIAGCRAPLFPNRSGERWSRSGGRRVLLAAMRATGLKFKPNECMRHAFGTHAAARGVDTERVSRFLGHRDPRTSRRYIRLAGGDLASVLPAQNCPHTVRGAKAPS